MTAKTQPGVPSIVIVGRPNVGKSTLFNRLTESRRSIVTDEPGITRDRIYGTAAWRGHAFEVVDTGGLLPEEKAALPREIFRQARMAIEAATQLVLVVDSRAGVTPLDAELARLLHRTGWWAPNARSFRPSPARRAMQWTRSSAAAINVIASSTRPESAAKARQSSSRKN